MIRITPLQRISFNNVFYYYCCFLFIYFFFSLFLIDEVGISVLELYFWHRWFALVSTCRNEPTHYCNNNDSTGERNSIIHTLFIQFFYFVMHIGTYLLYTIIYNALNYNLILYDRSEILIWNKVRFYNTET